MCGRMASCGRLSIGLARATEHPTRFGCGSAANVLLQCRILARCDDSSRADPWSAADPRSASRAVPKCSNSPTRGRAQTRASALQTSGHFLLASMLLCTAGWHPAADCQSACSGIHYSGTRRIPNPPQTTNPPHTLRREIPVDVDDQVRRIPRQYRDRAVRSRGNNGSVRQRSSFRRV